ncbi:hypothetical protein Hsc_4583 [Herbaspirillum seropedicae]|nr:hypothetical protein Hsc_4583 [Herbaspirillum seropedicae]
MLLPLSPRAVAPFHRYGFIVRTVRRFLAALSRGGPVLLVQIARVEVVVASDYFVGAGNFALAMLCFAYIPPPILTATRCRSEAGWLGRPPVLFVH